MKQKLIYGMLVLVTLLVSVTREAEFPRFLLAFELLFAAVMAVWVHWMARRLKISLTLSRETVIRGGHVTIQLQAENPTWFPVGTIRVEVVLRGLGGIKDTDEKLHHAKYTAAKKKRDVAGKYITAYMGADRRGTDRWQADIAPVHCGLVSVELKEVRVYDYIGLCSAKVKGTFRGRLVSVLPRIYPMQVSEELYAAGIAEGVREVVAAKAGDDTQEIFDTRIYQRGDTLRAVHWKLSAKEDDLIVKEFSMPVDEALTIAADCSTETPEAITVDQMDRFFDLTASLASYLLDEEQVCELIWYSAREQEVHRCRIDNEEVLYRALEELLCISPYRKDEKQVYGESLLRVTIDSRIFKGSQEAAASMVES